MHSNPLRFGLPLHDELKTWSADPDLQKRLREAHPETPESLKAISKEGAQNIPRVAMENPTHAPWLPVGLMPMVFLMKTSAFPTLRAEVQPYVELQQQIHEALRRQHPEWVQPNGESPICDAYESRFAELLGVPSSERAARACLSV